MQRPISDLVNLIDPASQRLIGIDLDGATQKLAGAGPAAAAQLQGSYALVARDGERVLLARSLDRPLRYFLAKQASGPLLLVAERIDEIRDWLAAHGFGDQFHPSYSRMVPAHHVTELRLVGCPE